MYLSAAYLAGITLLHPISALHKLPLMDDISVAAHTMYTTDYLSNSFNQSPITSITNAMIKWSSFHDINPNAPFWDIQITLENQYGAAMEGFIAFEFAEFDATNSNHNGSPGSNLYNICNHRDHFDSGGMNHSHIEFHDWTFNDNQTIMFIQNPVYLHLNTTHSVQDDGLWVNIVHLCITKGHQHRDHLHMSGYQRAYNPLGFLGGESLMAFPILLILGICSVLMIFMWICRMYRFRKSLIPILHWSMLFGSFLFLIDSVFGYYRFWKSNVDGLRSAATIIIVSQCIGVLVSLYARVMAMIISSGVGLIRLNASKWTMIVSTVYAIVYLCIYGRIEWLEVAVLEQGLSEIPDGVEHGMLRLGITTLNVVFVGVVVLNMMRVLARLQVLDQDQRIKVWATLMAIGWYVVGAVLALHILHGRISTREALMNPDDWKWCCLLRDGFWRILYSSVGATVMFVLRPNRRLLQESPEIEMDSRALLFGGKNLLS